MKRVNILNMGDTYAYTVESIVLFGSMLSDKKLLGDVDLAIELQPALPNREWFERWLEYRCSRAIDSGRRFGTTLERLAWPRTEVFRYLKSRSRSLSLHSLEDLVAMDKVHYKVLLGDPDRLAKLIPGESPS
jgi:hypothetical protein